MALLITRKTKASRARLRIALAKAKELARREKDLETCLLVEHRSHSAAVVEDYAARMAEYPDVFPAPPMRLDQLRARPFSPTRGAHLETAGPDHAGDSCMVGTSPLPSPFVLKPSPPAGWGLRVNPQGGG